MALERKKKNPLDAFAGSSADLAGAATDAIFSGTDAARPSARAPAPATTLLRRGPAAAPAAAPAPPLTANAAGQGIRSGANYAGRAADALATVNANSQIDVVNAVADPVRNFARGIAGQEADPNPTIAPIKSLAESVGLRSPSALPAPAYRDSPSTRGGLRRPGLSVIGNGADTAIGPLYNPATDKRPGVNTFNGQPVQGGAPAPAAPAVGAALGVDPQAIAAQTASAVRGQTLLTRGDASKVLNPMSDSAELVRRLEHSQNSYFNKGSPSSRNAIAQAYLGQINAQNAASAQGEATADAALVQGGAGTVQGALAEQAGTTQATLQRQEQGAAMDRAKLAQNGPVLTRGGYARLDGNTATPITDASGAQVQAPIDPKAVTTEGQITPAMQYKAYQDRVSALDQALLTPEQKVAAQAELQQEFAPLLASLNGGAQTATPPANLQDFMAKAKAANPNASEAELKAYYDKTYGAQ